MPNEETRKLDPTEPGRGLQAQPGQGCLSPSTHWVYHTKFRPCEQFCLHQLTFWPRVAEGEGEGMAEVHLPRI